MNDEDGEVWTDESLTSWEKFELGRQAEAFPLFLQQHTEEVATFERLKEEARVNQMKLFENWFIESDEVESGPFKGWEMLKRYDDGLLQLSDYVRKEDTDARRFGDLLAENEMDDIFGKLQPSPDGEEFSFTKLSEWYADYRRRFPEIKAGSDQARVYFPDSFPPPKPRVEASVYRRQLTAGAAPSQWSSQIRTISTAPLLTTSIPPYSPLPEVLKKAKELRTAFGSFMIRPELPQLLQNHGFKVSQTNPQVCHYCNMVELKDPIPLISHILSDGHIRNMYKFGAGITLRDMLHRLGFLIERSPPSRRFRHV